MKKAIVQSVLKGFSGNPYLKERRNRKRLVRNCIARAQVSTSIVLGYWTNSCVPAQELEHIIFESADFREIVQRLIAYAYNYEASMFVLNLIAAIRPFKATPNAIIS